MSTLYNPALHEEPRNQPITVAPPVVRETLLGWLESIGRFRACDQDEFQEGKLTEDLDDILEPETYESEPEEDQLD